MVKVTHCQGLLEFRRFVLSYSSNAVVSSSLPSHADPILNKMHQNTSGIIGCVIFVIKEMGTRSIYECVYHLELFLTLKIIIIAPTATCYFCSIIFIKMISFCSFLDALIVAFSRTAEMK